MEYNFSILDDMMYINLLRVHKKKKMLRLYKSDAITPEPQLLTKLNTHEAGTNLKKA